jgi:DNA-binding FadR family transcriptional regulator
MILSKGSSTLYEHVVEEIERLIRAGTMRPGDRIPSVRRASAQSGVSVTTIVQAYLVLEDRGLIEARPKSGFFVRSQLRDRMLEPIWTSRAKPGAPVITTKFRSSASGPTWWSSPALWRCFCTNRPWS